MSRNFLAALAGSTDCARRLFSRKSALAVLTAAVAFGCSKPPETAKAPVERNTPQVVQVAHDARYRELPKPAEATAWIPPQVSTFSLRNGVRIWHLEQKNAALVSFHVVLPGGSSTDPSGKAGLAALAADLLDEGAASRNALQLSDDLGLLATDYGVTAGLDYVLLSMNALAENFEASAKIMADIVRHPRLEQAEFQRRKDHHIAQAIARNANQSSVLSAAYHKVMFGNGYGSSLPEGSKDTLKLITLADVKNAARAFDRAGGTDIVVVGGITEAAARATLQKVFGDWGGKHDIRPPQPQPTTVTRTAYVVPFPGATQSSLAILRRAGGSNDPNYFPELVFNRPVGEAFTGRINLNLRESKGYTYGAFSTFRRYKHAGLFGVVANVKSEVTAASVKEVFVELEQLCKTRPLTKVERDEAVEGLLLGYPLRFERVDEIGMQVATLPIYGRPVDYWQTWPQNVQGITLERANEAARPYCDSGQYQIVVAGDVEVVRPGLEALGLKVEQLERPSSLTKQGTSGSP